jgi:hypothetical protein
MSFSLPSPAMSEHKLFGGQSEPWQEFIIDNFSGGLCTAFPESHIADNQFTLLTNFYHVKDGSLKTRGPYRPYETAASKDSICPYAPLSCKWVTLGATNFLVASWDTGTTVTVSVWDSTNSRWAGNGGGTAIKTGLDDDYIVEFCKFSINEAEDLIFCNGKNTPQRWIGTINTASSDLGLDPPDDTTTLSASCTDTADIQGIQYNGTYYYKFTAFYDSSGTNTKYGESGPTAYDNAAITNADIGEDKRTKATLSGCPAIPSGATKNYVYRSPPDQLNGPYRRVGYYSSGTTFIDNTPVGEEGDEIPADAGTPPKLKHPLVAKGRLWGIGLNASGELTNKLVWSAEGQPDYFPTLNFAYLPDNLIGPVFFKENIYVFTKKQTYVIPNGDVATYPEPLKVCDKGATSFQSIVDVGNGLIFQGEDNIYWVDFNTRAKDGDFPIPIGEPIKDKIENIYIHGTDYRCNSRACLHQNRYYLTYTPQNYTTNSATLVWDVEVGTSLLRQGLFGGWSALSWYGNDLQDFNGTLYTADNANKYIHEHDWAGEEDFYTYSDYPDSGHNINTSLTTKRLHFGQEWSEKIVRSLSCVAESSGVSVDASLDVNTDDFTKSATLSFGSGDVAVNTNWLIWDVGLWETTALGTYYWAEESRSLVSSHAKFASGAKGKDFQLSLNCSDSKDMNIVFLKLYWRSLPPSA